MAQPEVKPLPESAPVAGEESAIVQGMVKTNSSTGDGYKTEFVKIYQDAGVIGASMLTLLVLCFLLGMFCLRLLKMYVLLTESRDRVDTARTEVFSKVAEKLIYLETSVGNVITELRADHGEQMSKLDAIIVDQDRMNDRLDRYNEANHGGGRRSSHSSSGSSGVP